MFGWKVTSPFGALRDLRGTKKNFSALLERFTKTFLTIYVVTPHVMLSFERRLTRFSVNHNNPT